MQVTARNTNYLANQVYPLLLTQGVAVNTRNGPALRLPGVTTITLTSPMERVNYSPYRDANPFFHLVEAACMLAGDVGNNVQLLSYFAKNMANFSDDGKRYNAFYGTRIRQAAIDPCALYLDQLQAVIAELKRDPESRQALVQIWDPALDLGTPTKDKACNLTLIFDIVEGRLNMTTFNRSNDAIWGGVTGANVVHLPFFQEYVALHLRLEPGVWHHSSANLHVYLSNPKWPGIASPQPVPVFPPSPCSLFLRDEQAGFDEQLKTYVAQMAQAVEENDLLPMLPFPSAPRFVTKALAPAATAYMLWKQQQKQLAYDTLWKLDWPDWRLACLMWFKRREGITLNLNDQPHNLRYEFTAAQA